MSSKPELEAPPIEKELWAERATTLSRVTARLETALNEYQTFLRQKPEGGGDTSALRATHDQLEALAAEALWHLVIQREALGLRSHSDLMEIYAVPSNLRRKMGPRRSTPVKPPTRPSSP